MSPGTEASPTPTPSPSAAAIRQNLEVEQTYEVGTLVPASPESKRIRGFQWEKTEAIVIRIRPFGEEFRGTATLAARYVPPEADWVLLYKNKQVELKDGNFEIVIPVETRFNMIDLAAIGPLGDLENVKYTLVIPEWEEFRKTAAAAPPKRMHLIPALGFSFINYAQTQVQSFIQSALTFKASLTYLLIPPYWDCGASFFVNALPLSTSHPERWTARFLGANVRFGLALPFIRDPWRFSILPGVSYSTMFTSGGRFGFHHLIFPQLFPTFRRSFRGGDSIFAYFKFVSLAEGFTISLKSRELGSGMGWVHPLGNGHPISLALDWGSTVLLKKNAEVRTSSFSFSFGYGW